MHHEDWLRKEVEFSGDLFVDVGAHVGTWAIRASRTFRRVVAFEVESRWTAMLKKNVETNSVRNIEVSNIAISSSDSPGKTRTLDSYGLDPTLIKIDTEGAEFEVLKGAAQTLKRSHPRLVVETHTDELARSAKEILKDNSYNVREIARVNRWGYPQRFLLCD